MKRLLLLLLLLLPAVSDLSAQPVAPLRMTLDSLQRGYGLTPHRWQFQAGDDPRRANPAFDDRGWPAHQTDFGLDDAPPGWKGIGWFRLHFQLDSLPANRVLALGLTHVGASEVYIDGQKVGGFGVIGSSPETGTDYGTYTEAITFRLDHPGEHLLAVRLATFRPYLIRRARYPQGFISYLATEDRLKTLLVEDTRIWDINLVSVFVPGLFALLHLFLFLFYPARRSNLYYSGWLLLFVVGSACVYLDKTITNPAHSQLLAFTFWLANVGNGLLAVLFIYSVCYANPPRQVRVFYTLAIGLGLVLLFVRSINTVPGVFGFVLLCLLEVWRVVVGAVLGRQPGVWLIGVGLLGIGIGIFIGAGDVLGIWQGNSLGQNLFLTGSFLTLPLCTSLYLAQDFARTSRNLERQLRQVDELSAQTRAQEAEKLRLVARQNEQLEQTVQERTGQLRQQADKLRELDGFKSRFFTNLTHEFRTPLTLILGPAEQMLEQTTDPRIQQQAALIQQNGRRLLRLINQLLDLSKIEAGKMELNLRLGDLTGLIRATVLSFESMAHQKQIILRVSTAQDPIQAAFDHDALEKILYNLLSNALKFTLSGGQVSVGLNHNESWFQLVVQDSGTGIPAAKLPYIFDRFYQWSAHAGNAPDQREQEGTGIGLALTKELVELYGGTIHLRSQEGIGTTVTICLPVQSVPLREVVAEPRGAIPLMTTLNNLSPASSEPIDVPLVLLIEDNDDMRAFIRSSLGQQSGAAAYRILEAPSGEAGVQLAQQQVPDLVITDLMMPKMNGYQVCQTLKQDERTSHIPVIMLTAKADLDSKLEGLQTGADSYIAKPFNQRELLARMSNLIKVRRQLRERYSQVTLQSGNDSQTKPPELPSMERVFLDRVRAAIDDHLADEQYSVDLLSEEMGLSRTQLHRKLKALINQSPGDLLRLMRLQRAHELLRANVGTVAEVAYQVGFGNPANFSTSFSRQFGYAPSEVKKQSDALS